MASASYAITTSSDDGLATAYGSERKLARDSLGYLHAVWRDERGDEDTVYYGKSTDGGVTWAEAEISSGDIRVYAPYIAIDGNDYVHVAWYADMAIEAVTRKAVRYRRYTTEWETIYEIAQDVNDHYAHPAVAIDADNYVHVVWTGGPKNDDWPNVYYKEYTDSWQSTATIFSGTAKWGQTDVSIAIDGSGNIHVAWSGEVSAAQINQIRYMKYAGSWSDVENLTSESYDQRYPSMVLDSSDNIHIVWYGKHSGSTSYEQIRYIKYTDSWQSIENLTSPSGSTVNQHPTMSITDDDVLDVFYFHSSGDIINHIQYTDSWQPVETLISAGDNDNYPNTMWANYPSVGGVKPNVPDDGYAFIWTNGGDVWYYTDVTWPSEVYTITFPDLLDGKGRYVKNARVRAYRADTHAFVEEQYTDANGSATFTTIPKGKDTIFYATWMAQPKKERWFFLQFYDVDEGGTGGSTPAEALSHLGLGTEDSPQFTAINLGHASDTTITRTAAGRIAIEGVNWVRFDGTISDNEVVRFSGTTGDLIK